MYTLQSLITTAVVIHNDRARALLARRPVSKQNLIERYGANIRRPDLREEIAQCGRQGKMHDVCKHGLERIVSKKLNAPYRSGPSKTWIKVNPKSPRHNAVRLDKFSHLAAGIYSSCHRPKLSDKIG